jgi:hypothetical protein
MEPRYFILDEQGREVLGFQQTWECQAEIARSLGTTMGQLDTFQVLRHHPKAFESYGDGKGIHLEIIKARDFARH